MLRLFTAFIAISTLAGCASTVGAFMNRPVVEDNVHDVMSTMSLAADRRTVIVKTMPGDPSRGKFCAEPPPDTATGLKTELEASLKAKAKSEQLKAELEADGSLKDKLETTVVLIAERTATLDAFRTGLYSLCQFHLNGALKDDQIEPIIIRLIQLFESGNKPSQ